jgi:Zn-dependent metalloprotease
VSDGCAEAALGFVRANAASLGVDDPSALNLLRVWRSRSGAHVRFQQLHRAVPVIGALVDVHLDPGGSVCAVTGAFRSGLGKAVAAGPPVAIGKREAVKIALSDLGTGIDLRAQAICSELVYVTGASAIFVYKVILASATPLGTWVYLIDQCEGRIVKSYNTMRFVSGIGRVYLMSPVEDPSLKDVALPRMENLFELKGERVAVVNEDFPEARSETGRFLYEPDDTHFDEVMAYYHLDRIAEFFIGLDPSLASTLAGPLSAFVHAGERMDNAYYDPSTKAIYFGDGRGPDRLNDLAREAAVIYHEYTHAILDRVNPHLKGSEADALHEGYADYFGCSLTDDPQIGEWVVAARGEPHLRDLLNRKKYPGDLAGEAHADGEIWAGACWDLRSSLGREETDILVYESMHFLPEFATYSDAARGVAQAAETIYSKRYAKKISEIFCGRGLDIAPTGRNS